MPSLSKLTPIKKRIWQVMLFVLTLAIFWLALQALLSITKSIHLDDVLAALDQIPPLDIFLAAIVVAFGYLILTLYDAIAFRHLGIKLPFRKVAMTSFTAYAIGHTIGLAVLTASGVRFRMYRVNGVRASAIAQVVWLVSMAFTFGISTLVGLSLALNPSATVLMLQQFNMQLMQATDAALLPDFLFNSALIRGFGLSMLAVVSGIVWFSGKVGRHVKIRGWRFDLPPAPMLLKQIIISIIDLASVAFVLYLLLPHDVSLTYSGVFSAFIQSIILAILSHVPGGLGVFELTMLASLPQVDKVYLLAVLLVFRLLYYIIPFLLAVLLFLAHEVWLLYSKRYKSK